MEAQNDLQFSHDDIEGNNITEMSFFDAFLPFNFLIQSAKSALASKFALSKKRNEIFHTKNYTFSPFTAAYTKHFYNIRVKQRNNISNV